MQGFNNKDNGRKTSTNLLNVKPPLVRSLSRKNSNEHKDDSNTVSNPSNGTPGMQLRQLPKATPRVNLLQVPRRRTGNTAKKKSPRKDSFNLETSSGQDKADYSMKFANFVIEAVGELHNKNDPHSNSKRQKPNIGKIIGSPIPGISRGNCLVQESIDKKLSNFIDMEAFIHKDGFKKFLEMVTKGTTLDAEEVVKLQSTLMQLTQYFQLLITRTFTEHKTRFWDTKFIRSLFADHTYSSGDLTKRHALAEISPKPTPVPNCFILREVQPPRGEGQIDGTICPRILLSEGRNHFPTPPILQWIP